jgi:hypothetical protein
MLLDLWLIEPKLYVDGRRRRQRGRRSGGTIVRRGIWGPEHPAALRINWNQPDHQQLTAQQSNSLYVAIVLSAGGSIVLDLEVDLDPNKRAWVQRDARLLLSNSV